MWVVVGVVQRSRPCRQELASFLASKNAIDADTGKLILECVACQSTKVPIYAALVAALSNRQPSFARAMLEQVSVWVCVSACG